MNEKNVPNAGTIIARTNKHLFKADDQGVGQTVSILRLFPANESLLVGFYRSASAGTENEYSLTQRDVSLDRDYVAEMPHGTLLYTARQALEDELGVTDDIAMAYLATVRGRYPNYEKYGYLAGTPRDYHMIVSVANQRSVNKRNPDIVEDYDWEDMNNLLAVCGCESHFMSPQKRAIVCVALQIFCGRIDAMERDLRGRIKRKMIPREIAETNWAIQADAA